MLTDSLEICKEYTEKLYRISSIILAANYIIYC